MFGIGTPELIIILVITLVIFGPGKIPQIGSALGGAIKNFRKGSEEGARQLDAGEEKKEQ
jgi:sec-independent protein translocase protein TatA